MPRIVDHEERRAEVAAAVWRIVSRDGLEAATVRRVAAETGMSTSVVSHYFAGKDELVTEYLHRFDPDVMPGVFDRTDLTPRERLLAAFEVPMTQGTEDVTPLCPYIAAAVELHDPQHPASQYARDYKTAIAARLTETAREAGATNPARLGEQLALLIDGASARTQVLNSDSFPIAAAVAAALIDNAIPTSSPRQPADERGTTAPAPVPVGGE